MEDQRVLVTGGAGFIGSHLVDSLVEENEVIIVDNLSTGREKYVNEEAELIEVDVSRTYEINRLFEQNEFDAVFHLAADAYTRKTSAGWKDPVNDVDINAKGTVNVLEAVREYCPDARVVLASSAAVYGQPDNPPFTEEDPTEPISPYGVHKLTSEKYMNAFVEEQGLDVSAVRIFNTFGERQPRYVMYDFFKKLQRDNSELEVLGTGRQIRDYVHVSDTVRAFEIVAENGEAGEAYNLSGENVISINELAEMMIEIAGLDAEYYNTEESWDGDPSRLEADISKLKSLGFEPKVDLREGLECFKEYFEETEGSIKQ